jgi:pimeloyl-ACP methyl ester carboxylesterase
MATATATTANETLAFVPSPVGELFTILTEPTGPALGVAAVIFSSGHWVTSIGANRTYVRLARELAGLGYHAVRFDYGGIGESSGPTREYRLVSPFIEDAEAIVAWLREQGLHRFVFLGPCYGARLAMAAAVRTAEVEAVGLFPPVTRDYVHNERVESLPAREVARRLFRVQTVRGLRDPSRRRRYARVFRNRVRRFTKRLRGGGGEESRQPFQWIAPFFLNELNALVDRKVPLLLLMGEEDDFYEAYTRGTSGPLAAALERGADRITTDIVPGHTHGLASKAVQDAVVESLLRWMGALEH